MRMCLLCKHVTHSTHNSMQGTLFCKLKEKSQEIFSQETIQPLLSIFFLEIYQLSLNNDNEGCPEKFTVKFHTVPW